VNSIALSDVVNLNIKSPNNVLITDVRAVMANISSDDCHVLIGIGMDVITLGDFTISNVDGETVFSFAMPPFKERLTLLEGAVAANRQNVDIEKT
jgi:hypothetical protein